MQLPVVRPSSVFNSVSETVNGFLSDAACEHHIYPHQRAAVNAARQYFSEGRGINIALIVLPTGCGKTGVAVLSAYALNASRVLVITPSSKISSQIYEAFCNREKNFFVSRSILPNNNKTFQSVIPNGKFITKSFQILNDMNCPLMVANAHKIGGNSRIAIEEIPQNGYDLVIVDEAHHYPAKTWQLLINHFENSKRLFLTATPYHKGRQICYLPTDGSPPVDIPICFKLERQHAVDNGIIRDVAFVEVGETNEMNDYICMWQVADKIKETLKLHDQQDPSIKHQAMVLTQQKENLNAAKTFKEACGDMDCDIYVTGSSPKIAEKFNKQKFSTLIIVGRLLEGYDNPKVSVVAIVRNVSRSSKVLFAQFVGRAVRKAHPDDIVTTTIISHARYKQRENYENFDQLAEDDLFDDDND